MNLTDLLANQAAVLPDAVAVIHSDRSMTTASLDSAVWGLAELLHKEGVKPGDVLGLQVADPLMHLTASLALARMGAVHISLAPNAQAITLNESLLQRVNASAVVTDQSNVLSGMWRQLRWDVELPFSCRGRPDTTLRHDGGQWPVMYRSSSGTTGTPKLISVTHSGLIASIKRDQMTIGYLTDERYFTPVHIGFDAPKSRYIACIVSGGTAVLAPEWTHIESVIDLIDRHDIRNFSCVARHAADMANALPPGRQRFPEMRRFRLSAAPTSPRILQMIRERICSNIVVTYGCSELGPMTFAETELVKTRPTSVGHSIPGVQVQIVSDAGLPVAPNTFGIVRVRTEVMPTAYFDDPTSTNRHFRDGWFYPGDLGMLSLDGELTLLGRTDDLIIFEGVNIAPLEIESTLHAFPGILEAAAFPLQSETSHQIPAAAVVTEYEVDQKKLMQFVQQRLGRHAPAFVFFMDRMPRNQAGKIDKRKLALKAARYAGNRIR